MENRRPLLTLFAVLLVGALFGVNLSCGRGEPAGQPVPVTPSPATTTTARVAPAEAAFVGRTDGGEAAVAIAVKDGRAIAYLCDGVRTEVWLNGIATGNELALQGGGGGQLTGTVAEDEASGVIMAGDREWPFTADLAQPPAGLYRANVGVGEAVDRIGWIVENDGRTTGLRAGAGGVQPAPPLDLNDTAVTIDGREVPVEHVTGGSG